MTRLDEFWNNHHYISGAYDMPDGFKKLDDHINTTYGKFVNRIFYLALPPSVFEPVATNIKKHCMSSADGVWTRIIIEKPFGRDLDSSNKLSAHLAGMFTEKQIYRIDHYLGKEMIQNLIVLRFANRIFSPLWNRDHIDNVMISFKESFGTDGRGGYFDNYGIIRYVRINFTIAPYISVIIHR
ncbi:unnamed protein product [Protopolystoma xenopodis]|uniref:glucose-6-phosphate dehydrogenase (NADP(+)) n=1 Tax=Protopolystoma xenopodis TaxID=117903 RepID=A0A3S5A403_9PLAT|nr:unnamed protein product [Protopolystoma xenopodis]